MTTTQRVAPRAGELLRKQYHATIRAAGEGDRRVRFIISTAAVDRYGDVIEVDGWDLGNYRRNPVVLWAHENRSPPVARCVDIAVREGALEAVAEFASKEVYPFADTVYQLVRGGFLNATSVGFMPLKWSYDETRGGYDFSESELMEFSVVPVPANPEALIQARGAGIDIQPLEGWARGVLRQRRQLEDAATLIIEDTIEDETARIQIDDALVSSIRAAVREQFGALGTAMTGRLYDGPPSGEKIEVGATEAEIRDAVRQAVRTAMTGRLD